MGAALANIKCDKCKKSYAIMTSNSDKALQKCPYCGHENEFLDHEQLWNTLKETYGHKIIDVKASLLSLKDLMIRIEKDLQS